MQCRSVLLRLDPLRTGELDPRERQVVEDHLRTCPTCSELFDDLTRIATRAPALTGECPASFTDALLDRIFDGHDRVAVAGIELWVAFSSEGLTRIALGSTPLEELTLEYEKRFGRELRRKPLPEPLEAEVARALRGAGRPRPDVDLSRLPAFERRVLETLLTIPRGEVRTYAWVAREAGRPAAIRAVGNTCARNPVSLVVPCHRVVPSAGGIGRYAHGPTMKRRLLTREGVDVERLERLGRRHARYVLSPGGREYCFPTCRAVQDVRAQDLVPIRDELEAATRGLAPCDWCRPLQTAA